MDWNIVKDWLERHGHIRPDWETIEISNDGIYCSDTMENTIISIFTKVSTELVVFVGTIKPKVSVGGNTGIYIQSIYDVTDYLSDIMTDLYESLEKKWQEGK